MKKVKQFFFAFSLLLTACNSYYDKGKEYKVLESEITAPIQYLEFESSEICKECHELIYDEFMTSIHAKSSLEKDAIFKAVWEKHPDYNNNKFECAQCHSPTPKPKEGVSCAACHRIKDIEKHRKGNRAIYEEDQHTYFGIGEGMSHSHQSNSENELFRNGKVCAACHSHRENTKGYLIGITESESENAWENCVTCHMPLTDGTGTFKKMDRLHFNHSFPGVHNNQHLLEKHLVFEVLKNDKNNLEVHIKNKASHDLFIQAFRIGYVNVSISRNNELIKTFEPIILEKILEDKNGECLSIIAEKETKNSFIKGSENKVFLFDFKPQPKDVVSVELSYQLIKPNLLKKLKLEVNKIKNEITILKKEEIQIK